MSGCLIVSPQAAELAALINRLSADPPRLAVCTSAADALAAHAGERVIFGSPDLVAKILPHLPAVNWVQSTWAGVTPLIRCPRRDYVLTGVKDVFGPQMAEYVLGYLLAGALRIVERSVAQSAHHWLKRHSDVLAGKHLGILGTGSIGQHIARVANAFGLQVSGLSRSGRPVEFFGKVFSVSHLHDFLETVDYLVATLPETPGTDRLLDATALAKLRRTAVFVNVGRGNVVDQDALVAALRNGRLAGAVLDVFDTEPLPADSPLWTTPNLHLTAHVAAVSHPALIVPIFLDNYRRYLASQPLEYVVDFAAGY